MSVVNMGAVPVRKAKPPLPNPSHRAYPSLKERKISMLLRERNYPGTHPRLNPPDFLGYEVPRCMGRPKVLGPTRRP